MSAEPTGHQAEDDHDDLGLWNYLHGLSAGGASIAVWEAGRLAVEGGHAILVVAYTGITVGLAHAVHVHRVHLKAKRRSI